MPMTLADDKALFEAIWRALKPEHPEQVRMAVIDNTLHLEELWLSEALAREAEEKEGVARRWVSRSPCTSIRRG